MLRLFLVFIACLLAAPVSAQAGEYGSYIGIRDAMIADCEYVAEVQDGECSDLLYKRGGWDHARAIMAISLPTGNKDAYFELHIEVKATACVDRKGRWTGEGYRVVDAWQGEFNDDCGFTLPKW